MNTITPRDAAETATLSIGKRIIAAIGIIETVAIFTMVFALIAVGKV